MFYSSSDSKRHKPREVLCKTVWVVAEGGGGIQSSTVKGKYPDLIKTVVHQAQGSRRVEL